MVGRVFPILRHAGGQQQLTKEHLGSSLSFSASACSIIWPHATPQRRQIKFRTASHSSHTFAGLHKLRICAT